MSENRVPCNVLYSTGYVVSAECDPVFDHWGVWVDMPEALPIDGRFDQDMINKVYFPFLDTTWNVELANAPMPPHRVLLQRVGDDA